MLITVTITSLLFILISFSVTADNAKYLLSGYNTMPEAERDLFDLTGYLKFFKRFFQVLGVGLLTVFLLLQYTVGPEVAGMFFIFLVLLSFAGFVAFSTRFNQSPASRKKTWVNYAVAALLLCIAVGTAVMMYSGTRQTEIVFREKEMEFTGMYDMSVPYDKIDSIGVVDSIPAIKMRSNGFALGRYLKGDFKTMNRETIRLYVDTSHRKYLRIKTDDKVIFWSGEGVDETLRELENKI
ncbi:DUF3784 domain-containing protein [Emticicia sp. CRIBPO]|uniref:DUF3784 domain-containing protein n=1 Tax=Emticicia sp. CRIBPO TaxID=2683258 RepID=UPI001412AF8F|nr:DUF3784 domain-containing protein [Emticicia sp. CRIBPO]NBA87020.1 DUF3784 domain-containing protein [Emticicia sp. CRIBPO]